MQVIAMAMNISGNTYNYMNNFFSGLNKNKSSEATNGGMASLVGDFSAIRNGSYAKLAKKYYTSDAAKKVQSGSASASNKSVKEDSNAAVNSASKLMNKSLYEKKAVKGEDGKETMEYDTTKILEGVKDFVKNYNSAVKDAGESSNNNVLNSASRMVSQTKVYAGALSKVGINLKSDNTLELDETKFSAADMTDVRSLFTGSVSFGKSTQERLYQMYTAADQGTAQNAVYNQNAQYNISTGSMFDSLF